ncbi:MAG: hypothetical protein ABEJ72_05755 [Candidatus Aenigmatarchaeota archaeon]
MEDLTIQDREYRLNASEFSDPENRVREGGGGTAYVVKGEKPMISEAVVEIDNQGVLAKGEDFLRIGFLFNSRVDHYEEKNFAAQVYNAMEEAGISKPSNDPDVGVQIRPNKGLILIENTLKLQ